MTIRHRQSVTTVESSTVRRFIFRSCCVDLCCFFTGAWDLLKFFSILKCSFEFRNLNPTLKIQIQKGEFCKTLLCYSSPCKCYSLSCIRIVYIHISAGELLRTCQVDSSLVWLGAAEVHKAVDLLTTNDLYVRGTKKTGTAAVKHQDRPSVLASRE